MHITHICIAHNEYLYVDVYTEIPVSLNKQQRKVLEELRNLEENSNHPDSTNFTNKVNKTRQ